MASQGKVLRRANPSTIHDKFLVGYQGWFTCAGDGPPLDPGHHGWLHWFNFPIPDGGRPNLDIWPDVSEYSPSELFPAPGLKLANGEQAFLFSSRHPRTVQRHFHWMALHGVDGAFLQRFVGQCDIERGNTAIRNMRDEVGDRVREAAEKEGRVFAIMYDVVGVEPNRVRQVIEQDWLHLIHEKGILDSPNYLREKGRPVITLWGFGFSDGKHDPANVRAITNFIRTNTPGGAYIVAGVPAHWRTSNNDASSNHEWVNVWLEEFDAISPWTIGRYHSLEEVDRFYEEKMKGDAELIRRNNEEVEAGRSGVRKVEYIPVVLPGGSGFNLSEGQWAWNDTPRRGGNFMWKQLFNARRVNVRTIYGAMWDEYDEGTAYLPVVQNKRLLPKHEKFNFMALDEDGFDLPSDWYMRICGFAAEGLRGERMIHETFPNKELQDYWSTRPRYEDVQSVPGPSSASGSGSASGNNKNEKKADELWEDWTKTHGEHESDEPPPPPYTLEDTSSAAPIPGPSTSSTSTIQPQRQHTITSHSSSASQAQYHPPTPLGTRPTIEQSSSAPIPPSVSRPTLSSSDVSHLANGFQAPMQSSSGSYASAKPPPVVLTSRPNIPSQGTLPLSSNPYGNNIPTPGQLTQPQPRIDAGYCLANDFGKLAVGSQATLPPPPLVPKPSTSLSSSPPPLHPSHPKRLESQYRPLDTSLTKTPPPLHPKSPLKRIQSSGPSSMESSNGASAQQNASNSGATWGAGQHFNQTPSTAPSGGQSQQPVHQQSVYNPTYSPVYQNQPPAPSSSRPHAQPINHSYSMSSHSPSPPIPNGPPIPTPPAPGGISQSTSYTYGTAPASSYEQGVGGFSFPPAQPSFPTNDYYTQPVSGTAYGGPPPGQPQQYPQPVPPQPQYPPSQPQYPSSQPQPPQGYGAQPYGYGQPQAPGMYPGGVNGAAGYSQYPGQGQGQAYGEYQSSYYSYY
ncbi:hypothetical protein C8Q75DRAFT_532654 [Abortiporus biennis]|nr:hypothetical protein C8Q75DRAFT_532654 [Abortiporus biennis]